MLIENFRPDVMGRLGLDYDTLAAINPRLLMLSICGFGAGNPDSRRAAYAPIVHAEIGLVSRQAEISNAYPAELALSVADTNAGLHGLVGLLAALYARESTGKGDHLEIAMVDASVVTNDGMSYVLDGVRQVIANEVHTTAGGPLMIAGDFRFIWKQLTRHFDVTDGLPEGDDVPLPQKIEARRAAAHAFFNETCRTREAVIAALDKMNIAWGDVRPREEIGELASVQARGTIAQIDDRAGSTRPIPQSPYRFRHNEATRAGRRTASRRAQRGRILRLVRLGCGRISTLSRCIGDAMNEWNERASCSHHGRRQRHWSWHGTRLWRARNETSPCRP